MEQEKPGFLRNGITGREIKCRLFFGARAACGVTASAPGCRSADSVNNSADGPAGPLRAARAVTQTGTKKQPRKGAVIPGNSRFSPLKQHFDHWNRNFSTHFPTLFSDFHSG